MCIYIFKLYSVCVVWLHSEIELKYLLYAWSHYVCEKVSLKACCNFCTVKICIMAETFHPYIINALCMIQDPLF